MPNISTADAKNSFAKVLKSVQQGEKFVIEYGRKHKKIAMIVPYDADLEERKEPRKFDLYRGKFTFKMADDFKMTAEALLGLE